MNILVIGGGGREHALAWKLKQSSGVDRIFCAPGNAGTAQLAETVGISANDLSGLLRFAKQNDIDLTVVGPDDPLSAGIVDLFEADRLRIFGPSKSAARLESSKIFAKELMRAEKIPTAEARTFSDVQTALDYCDEVKFPIVIKADGLALGKGVIIAADNKTARSTVEAMMNERRFGEAGRRIVIEQFLQGTECSVHAFVDGEDYRLLESARDHKRIFDGDKGPNTGGMGAFSPANNWNDQMRSQLESKVMRPLIRALRKENIAFRGLLYPGLMITNEGPRVLEFNCRFGDPETQALLPRMKSDLVPLLEATIDGTIAKHSIAWDDRPSVTIVMASAGYPEKYETGRAICGIEEAGAVEGVQIFHAGTKQVNGDIVTAGGRVLAVTALGASIAEARTRAYRAVSQIHFEGCHYRGDIALSAVTG